MPQNRAQKYKLEDVTKITGRAFISIDQPTFTMGRSEKNDLVIQEKTVSGRHAAILKKEEGYFVVDLESSNKTLLNGKELQPKSPQKLNEGDTISLDTYTFVFQADAPEPPPSPEPPAVDDGDETVFFDSSAYLGDGPMADDSRPDPQGAPPHPPEDSDETVFFDSGALLETGADEISAQAPAVQEREGPTLVRSKSTAETEAKHIGNYRILTLLGRGGFGSVWKCTSTDGRPVAIKVLNPDILDNEKAVRKFFHEAIILSKLEHPNICSFIDFFPYEGNYAIVMDFVQGTDLKGMLDEKKGPLPFDLARRIAAQSLDAFHYAHQKNVLHRDIKPENITLDTNGAAKVMDFGIAKLSSSESQQTSLFMISPAYTAPERFDANKTDLVDHRSDIYSLGLVFYEIFTGTHPFPTTNPTEMIVAHVNKAPTPPNEVADVPQQISDGILKALEKDPGDRFEDFSAFKMGMLGEAPLRVSETIGAIEFSGPCCKETAAFLKILANMAKKHQKKAQKISVGQIGNEVHMIIETSSGNLIRITRSL